MGQGFGYNAYVGIGEESTYNTGVAATKFVEIKSEAVKGSRKHKVAGVLGSRSQKRTVKGKTEVAGPLAFPFQWNGCELWLKHAFGASSIVTTGTNPYTHTTTLKPSLPTGLSMHVNRDAANLGASTAFRYTGVHFKKLKLSQKIEEPLMCEFELIGGNYANVAIEAATFPTWDPIEYGQMTIASINPGGANYPMLIREWSMEIDNMIESVYRLLDFKPKTSFPQEQRQVTYEFTIELDSLTAYAYYRDTLTTDLNFKWVKDANTDLTITPPKIFFEEADPVTEGPGPYLLSMKATALMNAADNDETTLVLKNQTAGPI